MSVVNSTNAGAIITRDNTGDLILKTNGTESISAYNSGNVNIHNTITGNVSLGNILQQPVPVFKVYRTSAYSITNSTVTKVAFNAVEFDNYNGFSTSTYNYTVPISGYYRFDYGVQFAGTSITEIQSRLVTPEGNSSFTRLLTNFGITTASHVGWTGLSTTCFAEAGGAVYIHAVGNASSGLKIQGRLGTVDYVTYLAGHLVSRV